MIKFVGHGPKGRMLGFGLSDANLEKLRENQPIVVDLANITGSPEDGQVVIFWGKTEAEIVATMRSLNLVGRNTKITLGPSPEQDHFSPLDGGTS